ncbi:MAG: ATP-binding protein [Anaerolineae bacterium]|nr:ATP-binding protein [Gemmatimonadaceae bacterium]
MTCFLCVVMRFMPARRAAGHPIPSGLSKPQISARALKAIAPVWTAASGAAIIAAAAWLSFPEIRYLLATVTATAIAVMVVLPLASPGRRWAVATTAALGAFCLAAELSQRELGRISDHWPEYRAALTDRGAIALQDALLETVNALDVVAGQALNAPDSIPEAFDALDGLAIAEGERGVVVYQDSIAKAWAGRMYTSADSQAAALAIVTSPFHLALHSQRLDGNKRAVATAVLHADPPADLLADALDETIARQEGLMGYRFVIPGSAPVTSASPPGEKLYAFAPSGDTLLWFAPVAPGQAEARLRALERARVIGGLLLAIALALFVAAVWRREHGVAWRVAPLGVALASLALVPLNTLSSRSFLFDPTVYFATFGGPFTASVGALMLASAIVLLGMFVVLRARVKRAATAPAILVVLLIMAGGPFLLRDLSRGISAPTAGVRAEVWIAWEIALFLAAAAMLLGAASAGSVALGRRPGVSPVIAPILAAIAAILAPVVLHGPGNWPAWYPIFWTLAIGALAVTRRHSAVVLAAAGVAALGATTLAWRADVRGRVQLAERDVGRLSEAEPYSIPLLERLGERLASGDPPASEAALLKAYAESDLAGSGYPLALGAWSPEDSLLARVALSQFEIPPDEAKELLSDARGQGEAVVHLLSGTPGTYLALAVPFPDSTVATALLAPRTRLIPDAPYNSLIGVPPREVGEPPYTLTIARTDSAVSAGDDLRWYRDGEELHGHRIVQTVQGSARAHIVIDLRSLGVLLQRGTLIVLLDLALILLLWTMSVLPNDAFRRWFAARRTRWARSYRARLTVALFAFFLIPAAAFATWSYQRLRSDDRQSRALLVLEALRSVTGERAIPEESGRTPRGDLPLLLYRGGVLRETSDPLLDALTPVGRFLHPDIYNRLTLDSEPQASEEVQVGSTSMLFGFRAVEIGNERIVVSAPARGNDDALDSRRRDLGVLVLFLTLAGALGALWLSGVAARSLAKPIGELRGAALALAGGELHPLLPPNPPAEFVPVFSAFRRMGGDIRESRAALLEAERRTAAVLRNVASGVIAVDRSGVTLLANPRAEALLGAPLEFGSPIMSIGVPELTGHITDFLAADLEDEEFDLAWGRHQLHVRLARLTRGGGGAVLTLDDVTELSRAQRVLAWGEMARQVAHEIKNPLTPIRLGIQHLVRARGDRREDFDEILGRNANRILAEIDRLDQIARSFSRYGTAPDAQTPAERTDVAAVARDVVELERLGRGAVEWIIAGADSPANAQARHDELHEALLNILENARLAAARRVELRIARVDGVIVIEVSDNGVGVPAHILPRIFEPHFSTRTSGSGLGLAITRRLIEGWGGEIAIESEEGKGTMVRIELLAGE